MQCAVGSDTGILPHLRACGFRWGGSMLFLGGIHGRALSGVAKNLFPNKHALTDILELTLHPRPPADLERGRSR